jgi:hypothetical protein
MSINFLSCKCKPLQKTWLLSITEGTEFHLYALVYGSSRIHSLETADYQVEDSQEE